MSRSGYSDGWDNSVYLWRGAVNSAVNGKRGQAFLRDLRDALEAKPEKTLVKGALETRTAQITNLKTGLKKAVKSFSGLFDKLLKRWYSI
jgi:hypothetical protein